MGANKSAGDTLLRQWHMLRAIPRHPIKVEASAIQSRLETAGYSVSKRTVERDLVELSGVFPLVRDDRDRPYGWSWMKGAPAFDVPNLSNQEALAFAMIENYLKPLLPHALLDQLKPYFALAHQHLGADGPKRGSRSWLGKIAALSPTQTLIPPRIDRDVQAALTDALLHDRQVSVKYRRRGETATHEYVLNPLALVQRGPITYFLATAFEYKDIRTFSLHRVQRATMLETPIVRPKDFDLDRHLSTGVLDFGAGKRIRLDVVFRSESAIHLYESPLAADQELTPVDDDHVRLQATVNDTPQLGWWLLAFGDNVEVKGPAALRQQFAAVAQSMAAAYATAVRA
jgi:predicted DNA-binding transcriptional regulator YafY